MLAAVYADPSANGPREVYGDWLQQQGDPRGELIAIQMARVKNPDARFTGLEKALLDEHRERWRGPLPTTATDLGFRCGFVEAARNTGPITDDPSWATFVRATGVPLSDHANVPLLTVVEDLRDPDIIQLARLTRPLAIEQLVWKEIRDEWISSTVEDALDAFERITVLPKLRRLELERSFRTAPKDGVPLHELKQILAARWLRLSSLRIRWPIGTLDVLVATVARLDLETLDVEVTSHIEGDSQLELTRDESHRLGKLYAHMRWRSDDPGWWMLLAAIDRLPPDQLSSVRIPRAEDRQAWEHALRRQTRLERIYVV